MPLATCDLAPTVILPFVVLRRPPTRALSSVIAPFTVSALPSTLLPSPREIDPLTQVTSSATRLFRPTRIPPLTDSIARLGLLVERDAAVDRIDLADARASADMNRTVHGIDVIRSHALFESNRAVDR